MKLSRWNSFIPIGKNSGIIYNSFTDTFVCVKEKSKDFIFAKNGEIDNFSKDFTDKLIKAGALVDEVRDEVISSSVLSMTGHNAI